MLTILRIGVTDYDHTATGRAAAGIFALRYEADLDAGRSLSFNVKRCGADAPFVPGVPVTLTTTDDDGSNPVLRFVGDLDSPQLANSDTGYVWAYTCTDLQNRANWVTITGVDGTGTANFNLTPDDPLALYATSGQTVGAILKAILEAPSNAGPLSGYGVGHYSSLTPPTLPSATITDLAALTIVPATPVQLRGDSLFNAIQSLVAYWHPKFALWIEPDGTIRCGDVFAFPAQTLTVPTDTDNGDPIEWPTYSGPNCTNCFTAVEIHGLNIQRSIRSLVDGTAIKAWDDDDEADWTINDWLRPGDASDEGDCTVTSVTATVTSDFASHFWATNFWNASQRGGWIQFFQSGGSGIDLHEERQITTTTALAPGGSSTIGWDASLPLATTSYDRYRIVGLNSPKALVGRKFFVREPAGPLIGRATYVGSHMYPRFPKGSWLANLSSTQEIFYPTAVVRWSTDGSWPWFEVPIKVQIDPRDGSMTLSEPDVTKFGDPAALQAGYPTTYADGKPYDILFFIPYNKGGLSARYPATGHAGQANSLYGIQRVKHLYLDSFTWNGDTAALVNLAAEHLAVVQDPVIEGAVMHHGIPAGFDPFALGMALDVVTPGQTTRLDDVPLPVRTVIVDWPDTGELHTVTMQFSTQRRPFQGDDLYIHPGLSGRTFGTEGELWSPGFGGDGTMGMGEYNGMAQDMGQMATPASNPLSAAMQNNPMANQGNALSDAMGKNQLADSMGSNPLSTAMSNNQIGDAMANFGQGGMDDFGSFSSDTSGGSGRYKGSRLDQRRAAGKVGPPAPPTPPADLGSDITGAMLGKARQNTRGDRSGRQDNDRSADNGRPIDTTFDDLLDGGPSIGGI